MAYNPTIPLDDSLMVAGEMRSQFQGLAGMISGCATQGELNNGIAGTAQNCNSVQTLGITISDPPTQAEVLDLLNKVNELITALHR